MGWAKPYIARIAANDSKSQNGISVVIKSLLEKLSTSLVLCTPATGNVGGMRAL